ncbi:LAMI_0B04214g1_1 [Lachancea mirantina]|uniref:Ubiquitin carboxyl-terminal hydrolase n=1 Tax=Lachancea mirantina TaxID=1230905 RepID=A0A1G4IVV8_9SACH|nr:LAMI_0B04214g1_1 [Lachancea mirantina]
MSLPKSVVPLESNPEVFTGMAKKIGLKNGFEFYDIFSLTEPDLLAFLPRPMTAIILLFPLNRLFESSKDSESTSANADTLPVWFQQKVRNACGLYALLHSLSNNADCLIPDSLLGKFLQESVNTDNKFDDETTDNFIISLGDLYSQSSSQGQTEAPDANDEVDLHFITFVNRAGEVYELDGRRGDGAKSLGKSSSQDLLEEPVIKSRVQWYMDNADEDSRLKFSLLGLGPSWD